MTPCRAARRSRVRSSSLPRIRAIATGSFSESQPFDGRAHHVVRVRRPERLGQDVGDAAPTSTTARTAPPAMMPVPSGAGFSSTLPAPKLPMIGCGIVAALQRHADQVLLRRLDALLDRRRHFLRLADAEADHAVAVADDDQRAEAQVLAALDHLGHAVDRDDGVLDVELRRVDALTCCIT